MAGSQLRYNFFGQFYECTDGLPVAESPLYNVNDPFKTGTRVLRYFYLPFQSLNGVYYDPLTGPIAHSAGHYLYVLSEIYQHYAARRLQSWSELDFPLC